SAFTAGKQARLRLAEQLANENKEQETREAQLHLLQLRAQRDDPQLAAQAVEALARLMLRKGLLDHAAYYWRELSRDFAGVLVKDGKTVADFYKDLATDKRFLPYLDEPRAVWPEKLEAKKISGTFQMQPLFTFEADGDVLPFFQKHRVAVTLDNTWVLKLIDRADNREYFQSSTLVPSNYLYNNFRHTYRTQGHLLFLSLGHMLYAFDAVDKKKLWEYNLYSPSSPANS